MPMEWVEALVAHIQGLSSSADEVAHLHALLKQADLDSLRAHSSRLLPFLSLLHPRAHSLGYLHLLEAFSSFPTNLRDHGGDILVIIADFIAACSEDQISLAPNKFVSVCTTLKDQVMELQAPIRGIAKE